MKIDYRDIDKLLKIVDTDTSGVQCGQLLHNLNIRRETLVKAKNMGYVRFFNQASREWSDFFHDSYFCRITEEGSRALNRYGGFENILKYDRTSRFISYAALAISISTLIVSIVMVACSR